jgi:hypothetical protein
VSRQAAEEPPWLQATGVSTGDLRVEGGLRWSLVYLDASMRLTGLAAGDLFHYLLPSSLAAMARGWREAGQVCPGR